jgi:hypothetical protein
MASGQPDDEESPAPVGGITYEHLTHPMPAPSYAEYPFYTPGGGDKRWLISGNVEEEGHQWVGGLMSVCRSISGFN